MRRLGKLAYDEGATVGTLLSVRFALAAALFWLLVPRRELRGLGRRDVAHGASGWARAGTRCRPGCTSPRSSGSTPRCCRCSVYTFPVIVAVAAVALAARAARRGARRVALCWPRAGWCSSLAGAAAGALDPLGAALGLATAVVYSGYILVGEGDRFARPPRGRWRHSSAAARR